MILYTYVVWSMASNIGHLLSWIKDPESGIVGGNWLKIIKFTFQWVRSWCWAILKNWFSWLFIRSVKTYFGRVWRNLWRILMLSTVKLYRLLVGFDKIIQTPVSTEVLLIHIRIRKHTICRHKRKNKALKMAWMLVGIKYIH